MDKDITISIIGAGPGGYEAAILASKLGAKVNLIENKELGGTCLNKGCIPTKIFLHTANKIKEIKDLKSLNIDTSDLIYNFKDILDRKNKDINKLRNGINNLIKSNHINFIKGEGKLIKDNLIQVKTKNKKIELPTDYTILATGSSPIIPESFNYNKNNIITTEELFDLEVLPETIVIIGGGVAAVEICQYLSRFGVKVTIIEAEDHILPNQDKDIIRKFTRILKKDKVKILTKTKVNSIKEKDNKIEVITDNDKVIVADMALICVGRTPNTNNIYNESLHIRRDNNNLIKVNNFLQTDNERVYAIGDIVNSPMLAHMASHEAFTAVNNILGNKIEINYKAVPNALYTEPEITSVGYSEDELKEKNIPYLKGTFPFRLLGKAISMNQTDGMVKILTDPNQKIIGATIFGTHASDLIMELVLAIEKNLSANEISDLIHPHPSLSEAILEAARDVSDLSINKL